MKSILLKIVLLLICSALCQSTKAQDDQFRRKRSVSTVDKLKQNLKTIARQLMLQQFYVEEQHRACGSSGLKRIRLNKQGSESVYTPTYGDENFAAIHDHSNYADAIGLGELIMVLNGIEFRTRHLDYKLKMKSRTSKKYGAMEKIPSPDVPPAVTALGNVKAQIAEMKEWFRAFKEQNYKTRDYRPYFKPVLCYMEGMWTNSDQSGIDESFDSDRHHLDAKSWMDMQEKSRFTSYTGSKDALENYAYLPTTLMDIDEDGTPNIAQWNFKISCHPLSDELPVNRLQLVEDIKMRLAQKLSFHDYASSRAGRYRLSPVNKTSFSEGTYRRMFLDLLMEEIPGMDNYQGNLKDDALGDTAIQWSRASDTPKNTAYYHRWYRSKNPGAMGLMTRRRSFGDENVFMAMNTQNKIADVHVEHCTDKDDPSTCKEWNQKWSYAVPLEIIYTTPLNKWNPYKIIKKGKPNSPDGRTVTAGGRTGENSAAKAYNGIHDELFYQTPADFFDGEVGSDPADTIVESLHVLDKNGVVRRVSASGHRTLMNVTDVGIIRQRYPIMPIHEGCDSVWKEMEALTKVVLQPDTFGYLKQASSSTKASTSSDDTKKTDAENKIEQQKIASLIRSPDDVVMKLGQSSPETNSHVHYIVLTRQQLEQINSGGRVTVMTDEVDGYQHELIINVSTRQNADGEYVHLYNAFRCDGNKGCVDGHEKRLTVVYPSP